MQPSPNLINSVPQGGSWTFLEKITSYNGASGFATFTQTDTTGITLTCPPSGTVALNPGGDVFPQITANVQATPAPGTYEMQFTVACQTHSDCGPSIQTSQVFVTVTPSAAPDFPISSPTSESVAAGGTTVSFTVGVVSRNGFTGTVGFTNCDDSLTSGAPACTPGPNNHVALSFTSVSSGRATTTLTTTWLTPSTVFQVPIRAAAECAGWCESGFFDLCISCPGPPAGRIKFVHGNRDRAGRLRRGG